MTANEIRQVPAVGFLTVCESAEQGWFGGYLIVNTVGRPLEFHCTAPVKPNRAQEILYGPTLRPYLLGEQIGRTLVRKGRLEPTLVCTDVEPMLAVRDFIDPPTVLVLGENPAPAGPGRIDFALGSQAVAVPTAWATDRETLTRLWPTLHANLDLLEPFARIRAAIDEARKSAA